MSNIVSFFASTKGNLIVNVFKAFAYVQILICFWGAGRLDEFSGLGASLGLFFMVYVFGVGAAVYLVKNGISAFLVALTANILLFNVSKTIVTSFF